MKPTREFLDELKESDHDDFVVVAQVWQSCATTSTTVSPCPKRSGRVRSGCNIGQRFEATRLKDVER
jgi:hypothetical protein